MRRRPATGSPPATTKRHRRLSRTRGWSTTTSRATERAPTSGPLTSRRPMNTRLRGRHADLQHQHRHDQPRRQRRQRRHRVRQGHGGQRAVRGRRPAITKNRANRINTLRSSSVLTACVEPGKCAEVDVVWTRSTRSRMRKTETDKGAASLTFYGRCSSFVEGNLQPCTLAVPVRPPPPPGPARPRMPPPARRRCPPAIAPFPNAAPLRTLRSRSTARVP